MSAPAEPYPHVHAVPDGAGWAVRIERGPADISVQPLPADWPANLAEHLATALTTRMRKESNDA